MSVRLFVLGLLRERPQHGYELHRWLERSRTDLWADVLPGSIYHALRQLHKEGLIEIHATEQTGNRSRAIYTIAPSGQQEFERLLRERWRHPPRSFPVALYTLLTFSHHVPTALLRESIQQQITALEHELERWQQGEMAKEHAGVLPHLRAALFENGRSHLNADLRLLHSLLSSLPITEE